MRLQAQRLLPQNVSRFLTHVLTALYGLACLYLYRQQSVADLSAETLRFQSDLPLHISMIVEDGWYYSFTAYVYKLLYSLSGNTLLIALFLALVSWATVYATEYFLLTLTGPGDAGRLALARGTATSLLLALSLNLVMPIYLPSVGEFRYVSYQSGSIWHNSTYICMKLTALLTLTMYFRLRDAYATSLSWKCWCGFALLNILTTGIKPSFLLAFSPIMGIGLVFDLIKKVPLKRVLLFGSALLPSGVVLLWQNTILFGRDTGNGIAFRPWYTFSLHARTPKLAVVCSAAFCGLVLLLTLNRLKTDRSYRFVTAMSVLGFLEALCLVENGERSVDGNFLWGYSFCLFTLFAVTALQWLSMPRTGLRRALRILCGALFAWHLYCGVYFFLNLLSGASYWM